jgi:hypothetical protein
MVKIMGEAICGRVANWRCAEDHMLNTSNLEDMRRLLRLADRQKEEWITCATTCREEFLKLSKRKNVGLRIMNV